MVHELPALGAVLRRLRLAARLSQRDLALRVGFHESGVSNIERGERAPSAQYLHSVIVALRLEESVAAEIWHLYRAPGLPLAPAVPGEGVVCPYRGLSSFGEDDSGLFFGRATSIRRIVRKLDVSTLVAVVGASGSGKSSVVLAGVVPSLRRKDPWDVVVVRPGVDPGGAVARALAGEQHAGRPAAALVARQAERRQPLLLVIDQFEEVFTHGADDTAVGQFLDALVAIADDVHPFQVKVLLTFRGDFYGRVIAHRAFSDALQDHVVHLPAMSRSELHQAITEPARLTGLVLEPGLVGRILDDAGAEPGNLPLLEFALTRMWEHRRGNELTVEAYERIGRLPGALTTRAEAVYTSLSPEQQYAARQLLVRLVQVARPEEDGNDARRRTRLEELSGLPGVTDVIRALADARLVVTDADPGAEPAVELAHEAIIRSWERLRGWLVEDRQFLLWQQRTRQWMQEWRHADDPEAALLRGGILDEAQRWLTLKGRVSVAPDLLRYIDTSIDEAAAETRRHDLARVDQLLTVVSRDAAAAAASFEEATEDLREELRRRLDAATHRQRWRLRLALLPADPGQAQLLIDEVGTLWPDEIVAVRDATGTYLDPYLPKLWKSAAEGGDTVRLAAAAILASRAADDRRWHDIADLVASSLISQNQLHLRTYVDALRQVRLHLLEPLFRLYADASGPRTALRETAAAVILDLGADQPPLLARLAAEALPQNYEAVLSVLDDNGTPDAVNVLRTIAHTEPDHGASEADRVKIGRRRATALCTLMRLGHTPNLDQVLVPAGDPELVTQFSVNTLQRNISSAALLDRLDATSGDRAAYALLLALGDYADRQRSADLGGRIGATVRPYLASHDAGVRAAATWLLRRWNQPATPTRAAYDPTGHRNWFTAGSAGTDLTFVVLRPGRFVMGSPDAEAERSSYESPRQHTAVSRSYALCDREVTRAEFEHFMTDTGVRGLPNIDEWSPSGREPVVAPTWHEALLYADWKGAQLTATPPRYLHTGATLSDPAVQRAVEATPHQELLRASARLPTEAEWEYACRAGTTTAYSFGSDRGMLHRYGWFADNSDLRTHEAELLRPNQAGLFNIHGQCWEWCLDWYGPYTPDRVSDPGGPPRGDRKVLRGGCWNLGARYARSACRNAHIPSNRNYYITFRLALTIPEIDPSWQPGDPNPLPWTA